MDLVYGAGRLDRCVAEAEVLLAEWREREADWGQLYLEHEPRTSPDELVLEDLAVTMLINSRVAGQAAAAVQRNGARVDLRSLPARPLEETDATERERLAELIGTMTGWPWIGASLATKTLHKKRPGLVPILDNQAIFGAYMNPRWPKQRSLTETIKSPARIHEAVEWIFFDLTRPENTTAWDKLHALEPDRTRIELFDMVWWIHFRRLEPVAVPTAPV